MRERADTFTADDRTRLHYRAWEVDCPRSVLLVAHGLGEHSGRYASVARTLGDAGVSTYALDHRGHGRSDGQRGYVKRFEAFVADLERFRRLVDDDAPAAPRFLLGHSMGGLITLRHLQIHAGNGLAGAILSSPLLGIAPGTPRWKTALGRVLACVLPRASVANGIDPALLSHDPATVRAYRSDPLVHDRITPVLYREMRDAVERARAHREPPAIPLLLVVAGADRVVDSDATLAFSARLPAAAVTVQCYPGLYHETLNEPGGDAVLDEIAGWIGGIAP